MRKNIGELTFWGFLGSICLCLIVGVLVYSRFTFTQQKPAVDQTNQRVHELELKLAASEAKQDRLEERLSKVEAKVGAAKPA